MLTLSLVFSSVAVSSNFNFTASATDNGKWSDHAAESVASVNNVYSIDTAEKLAWIAKQVNSGSDTFSGKTIKLTKDIDLDGYQWIPIGLGVTSSESGVAIDSFQGNFDGQNYTISNMHIGNKDTKGEITYADYKYAGLFGYVLSAGNKVSIENVNIGDGSYIYVKNSDESCVGAVCATAVAAANTLTINNCSNSAVVSSSNTYIGGICGGSTAYGGTLVVSDCSNSGSISSSSASEIACTGGICGGSSCSGEKSTLTISNCSNSGSVSSATVYAGGICGGSNIDSATQEINNCSNSGNVFSVASSGGICGGASINSATLAINNCSNSSNVSSALYAGGICGASTVKASSLKMNNCSNSGNVSISASSKDAYAGGICGAYAVEGDAKIAVSNTYYKNGCVGTYDKDGKFTSADTQKGIGNKDDIAGEVSALSDEQMKAAAGATSGTGFKVNDKTYYALIDVLNDWVDANSNNGYLYWTIENNGYPVPGSESRPSVNENTNKPSEQKNAWVKVDNNWTYWKDGKQVTGWLQDGGDSWYYCDVNTGFMKTGWFQDGGSDWFYCDVETGVMETGWFQDSDSTWYYFFTKEDATERGNREGAMAANQWVYSNNTWYYLGDNGAFLYAE